MQIQMKETNAIKLFLLLLTVINASNLYGQQKTISIALAQIFCLDGDRSGNFVRIENAINEAKEKGAEIVCFPETSILGWVNPDAYHRAYPIPGEDSNKLCELAKKYNISLSIGLAEKDNNKLFDSAILIDNEGNILLKHRKINILTELMTPPYIPGTDVKVVDTKLGRIGILICADAFGVEILNQMKELKPDFVLIPYGWAYEEDGWPEHAKTLSENVQNAAKKIGVPVFGTDLVGQISHGPWTGQVYGGSSIAADENGNIIATGKDRDRDIVVTTIHYIPVVIDEHERSLIPEKYALFQNYPNPFNPSTMISYSIKKPSQVNLKITDLLGREIMTLIDAYQDPETYTVCFNAFNLSNGIYFYQLKINNKLIETKKMIILR